MQVVFHKGPITIEMQGKALVRGSPGDNVSGLRSPTARRASRAGSRQGRRWTLTFRRTCARVGVLLVAAGARGLSPPPSVRIKDIATVAGVRGNQVLGLGLVTRSQRQGRLLQRRPSCARPSPRSSRASASPSPRRTCAARTRRGHGERGASRVRARRGTASTSRCPASATRATSTAASSCRRTSRRPTGRPTPWRRDGS